MNTDNLIEQVDAQTQIQVSGLDTQHDSIVFCTCCTNIINNIKIELLGKLIELNTSIQNLNKKIKRIEKQLDLKELESKLNKHYEQSRRSK